MSALLTASIVAILFGAFVPNILLKIIVMEIGYMTILFIRDPFKLYIQDVVFEHTAKEHLQTLLTLLAFAVQVGKAAISLVCTLILLKYPLLVVMAIMLVLTFIELLLSLKLYKKIIVAEV